MTALEIRPEEIGRFDLAAYRARRARLVGAKPPAPVVVLRPQPVDPVECVIPRWQQIATLYEAPIGPRLPEKRLVFGKSVYADGNNLTYRRCRYYAQKHRAKHRLDDPRRYVIAIGPTQPVFVSPEIPKVLPVFRDMLEVRSRGVPTSTSQRIISEVCAKYSIDENALLSRRKTAPLILPRYEAAWRMKRETRLSYPQIGKLLNRDHTSIINAFNRYSEMLARGLVISDPVPLMAAE